MNKKFVCGCVYSGDYRILCNHCRNEEFTANKKSDKDLIIEKLDEIIQILVSKTNACAFSAGPYDNRNLKIEEEKKETKA